MTKAKRKTRITEEQARQLIQCKTLISQGIKTYDVLAERKDGQEYYGNGITNNMSQGRYYVVIYNFHNFVKGIKELQKVAASLNEQFNYKKGYTFEEVTGSEFTF